MQQDGVLISCPTPKASRSLTLISPSQEDFFVLLGRISSSRKDSLIASAREQSGVISINPFMPGLGYFTADIPYLVCINRLKGKLNHRFLGPTPGILVQ